MDTRKIGIDCLGKRRYGERFRQTRDAFEQYVPVRQQTDKQRIDQMLLPDDYPAHLCPQRVHEKTLALYAFVEFLDVDDFTHFYLFFVVCCFGIY